LPLHLSIIWSTRILKLCGIDDNKWNRQTASGEVRGSKIFCYQSFARKAQLVLFQFAHDLDNHYGLAENLGKVFIEAIVWSPACLATSSTGAPCVNLSGTACADNLMFANCLTRWEVVQRVHKPD
jgi:hypothetical protein